MKTVILDVRSPEQAMTEIGAALRVGKAQKNARISFATPELLWKVLTAKRAIPEVAFHTFALVAIKLIRHVAGQCFVRNVLVFAHAS